MPVSQDPDTQASHLARQAETHLRAGDLKGADTLYRQLADIRPSPDTWLRLAQVQLALDDHAAASESLQQAANQRPIKQDVTARIADLQFDLGQVQASLETLRQAVDELPGDPRLRLLLAQALEDLGQRDEALAAFSKALELSPGWGLALGGMLRVARENADPDWVEQAQERLEDDGLDTDERAVLGYGLGRVYERRDEPDRAMDAWERANQLRRQLSGGLDRRAARAHIDAQIQRYDSRALARTPGLESGAQTPVFIVGMPRSGTTLLEAMLAAHPKVAGFGELPTVARIAGQLEQATRSQPGDPAIPPALRLPREVVGQAATAYFRELHRRRTDAFDVSVDKAPLNFFHAGLIHQLFPDARILVCQRDPRDVCLSIYSENFDTRQSFATDLDDLVFYYKEYRRLVEHWKQVIPDRLREICYEDLVDAPEAHLKDLVDWIGLEWDPACLEFHRRQEAVLTPSKWQVRSPLYRSSMGRWRKYRDRIVPLIKAFGDGDSPRQ